jgi:hypothetical protein
MLEVAAMVAEVVEAVPGIVFHESDQTYSRIGA